MTFDARSRVNSAVNPVLGHIITTMGEGTLRSVGEFIARLDISLIRMTVVTERFVVARVAGLTGRSGIKTVLDHKIRSTMIEGTP